VAGHWHGVGSGALGRGGLPWELPEPTASPLSVPSSSPTAVALTVPSDENPSPRLAINNSLIGSPHERSSPPTWQPTPPNPPRAINDADRWSPFPGTPSPRFAASAELGARLAAIALQSITATDVLPGIPVQGTSPWASSFEITGLWDFSFGIRSVVPTDDFSL